MEYISVTGGNRLFGEVSIGGAKNAVGAIIPAAIAASGVSVLENLPRIEDVSNLVDAITRLGAVCEFRDKHTLIIDSTNVKNIEVSFDSVRSMRASYYLVGALLGRFGHACVALPGGCNFGSRPIDQHIKGFEAFGAKVSVDHGLIKASADRLEGANIYLDVVSVGATINIILAGIFAEGTTTIENAAREPHVVDTANYLNLMGANIKGAGTDVIRIIGTKGLHGSEYAIIPDQLEAGTYMIAAAAAGGVVTIRNIIPKHMDSLNAKLIEMNCKITCGDDYLTISRDGEIAAASIKTMPYPGLPTDFQPQMTALCSVANGTSYVTETVFDNRFQYVGELRRMSAQITVEGRMAVIEGSQKLTGAAVNATDLRAGAAMVIAGLAAEGETQIGSVKYIDRGYEQLVSKLRALGARIERVNG